MAGETLETAVESREKGIIRTSIIGIVVNLALAGFKAFVGLVSNSIAITLDAVLSVTVLLSALVYLKWNISLEAYVGVIISVIIIKAVMEHEWALQMHGFYIDVEQQNKKIISPRQALSPAGICTYLYLTGNRLDYIIYCVKLNGEKLARRTLWINMIA